MKIVLLVFMVIFSNAAYSIEADYKESEIIEIIKKAFPENSDQLIVKYTPKHDVWVFRFIPKVGTSVDFINGEVKDNKNNPEILVFREG